MLYKRFNRSPSIFNQLLLLCSISATVGTWASPFWTLYADSIWRQGGDPGKSEVYGWASWQPGKGILVLRNPSDKEQPFSITPKAAFELPVGVEARMTLNPIYPLSKKPPVKALTIHQPILLALDPFEVVVLELYTHGEIE